MTDARLGLEATLLVRLGETGELFVNFDPELLIQIMETNCMARMNLKIPPFAAVLQQKEYTLKKNNSQMQVHNFQCFDWVHTVLSDRKCIYVDFNVQKL